MDRPARALRLGAAWLAVGAVWLLAPTAAQGDESLGLSPGRYDVPTAQPGEAYVRELHLQNQFDDASDIEVTFQGEAGEWASTDPGGAFTVPPRSSRTVTLTVQVPGDAGPGSHQGQVTFTTESKEQPDGSGAAIRHGVGLLLNVTVGGEPVVRLEWLSARVEDAEQGQPVLAYVLVRNDGNVRAQPEAEGQVLPFDADEPVLSQGSGASALRPGEQGEVEVVFPAGLEVG